MRYALASIRSGCVPALPAPSVRAPRAEDPMGRPKLDIKRENAVWKALATGTGILKIAQTLGIGTGTVVRIAAEMRA